ncbi:MAG: hypothetical protein Q9218_004876 [Villophora microphyllina]
MLVVLKHLLFGQMPTHAAKGRSSSSGPNVRHANDGPMTALPQMKDADVSWVSNASSVDIEAGHAAGNPIDAPHGLSLKAYIRSALLAIKNFRPTPRMISDAIIGLADGMTVPFALTAGLSALGNTRIVVLGGVAELVSGMISMGVGGALGAKAEADGYQAKLADTTKMVLKCSAEAIGLVHDFLRPWGFDLQQRNVFIQQLSGSHDRMVDFLMRFHYQEKKPDPSRPITCGITIGLGYAIGGLIPLIPYFCVKNHQVLLALYVSIGIMLVTLFLFGFFKTVLLAEQEQDKSTWNACIGGFWMMVVGGGAAAVAVGVVHGINKA